MVSRLKLKLHRESKKNKTNRNWLPWQRPVRDRETNFLLIMYSRTSTNPQNLAKIDLVDFEIIGLTEVVKNKYKINKKQKQNIMPAVHAFSGRAG